MKEQLDTMVADGIIEPVSEPSDWCHPIVIVNKKGSTEKRLTVDLQTLNRQVKRPTHPMSTARSALSGIGSAKWFTKLDARHGYWQIPLSDASRPLTTFITPWSRFRYCRNPQGLISAGDEFNRRTDAAFAGIRNLVKVVDDGLVHDDSFQEHYARVRAILVRARENSITLSAKKFIFGVHEVEFCGFSISADSYVVDPAKVSAIQDFPLPSNRTDLRSFFGLVNQCGEFTPRLAEVSAPLRPLLKTSCEFMWDSVHTAAFNATRAELASPSVLSFYRLGDPIRLETDASALNGLGFALWQLQDDQWRLLQCGSRFLSDAESRYAIIELELLAVVWAVRKCSLFLSGAAFELCTDHRPLVPILNSYSLDQIENPRLQRLVLKLRPYQLSATWRKGTDNAFADALSRNPVSLPIPDEEFGEDPASYAPAVRACIREDTEGLIANLRHHELLTAARADDDYQILIHSIRHGFPAVRRDANPAIIPYLTFYQHLSVDNGLVLKGQRIVVPHSLRARVLQDLHASHQGLTRTLHRARQVVYWPNMTNDLSCLIKQCEPCRLHAASQPKEPLRITDDRCPTLPFESTSADLFSCQGWEYLVYVDRKTGWPCVAKIGRTASSTDVIHAIRGWFANVGVPRILTTDGGPQFSSRRFADFCSRWGVTHLSSSPHYPQSNGHAEAAVKAMKTLILKTTSNGDLNVDSFQRGLLEWHNTPRANGESPAQALFHRPLTSFVLAHHSTFAPEHQQHSDLLDSRTAAHSDASTAKYDASAQPLPVLRIGLRVDLKDPRSKLWSSSGIIVALGRNRDYLVKVPSGRTYWRNRRFLRPRITPVVPPAPDAAPRMPAAIAPARPVPPSPRRSHRRRAVPNRLNISSTSTPSYD